MIRKSVINLVFLLGGIVFSMQPFAQENNHKPDSSPAKQEAVKFVKSETGGRVLDVKQKPSGQGDSWRVKFLKDGKIQYMDVKPQSLHE